MWTTAQVGQWLMVLGMEQYIKSFQAHEITGIHLLNLDSTRLKVIKLFYPVCFLVNIKSYN